MRIQKLREAMSSLGADAALITSDVNVRYYSGFSGDSTQLLITQSERLLFTDFRYTEQAEAETDFDVIETKGGMRNEVMFAAAEKAGARRIGFDLSGVSYIAYQAYLKHIKARRIADLSDAISAQRIIKDDEEIATSMLHHRV